MYTFICENSIDGIFTGVYDAWASRFGHRNVRLTTKEPANYELFQEYITVATSDIKSRKVARTLWQRLGAAVYESLCQAILADEQTAGRSRLDKADCIYRTIVLGLSMPDGSKVLQALGEPYVHRVFELNRATACETHHYLGFLRFSELENGVLFSPIHPKNHVLPILGAHFTDRLPLENFLIYDGNRALAAVHKSGSDFLIADASDLDQDIIKRYSGKELEYRKLWCGFFDSIAIDARCNPPLQQQNMPKRFWKDTIEKAASVNEGTAVSHSVSSPL